jgi:hypothetical protein
VKRPLTAGCVALAAVAAVAAADPVALRSLFPKEADVFIDEPGLWRVDLPPEIVAECLPSLADVRLFDAAGGEVPFLLDTPRIESVVEREKLEARVLDVRREETPRKDAPPHRRETYELAGPDSAARGGEWHLVLMAPRGEFVARARITWGQGGSASGSFFRLTSPRPVERLTLPLSSGPLGRVTVTLEHESGSWLTPSFRFESSHTIDREGSSTIPLSILSTRSANKETVVALARPRGVVPAALRFSTTTPAFFRRVTVYDDGGGAIRFVGPRGEADLFQLEPGSDVRQLDVSLSPARAERLRIVIDDGDSPPLAGLSVTAVFPQPSLVASLTSGGGSAPAAVLRFGGGRANVPRYDLAAFSAQPGSEVYGKRAEALVRIYDPAVTKPARISPVRPNPAFDRTPALSFAMRAGASIDKRPFKQRRSIQVEPSPEGLSRLRLLPEDLAALSPDFADLRIVDGESRQWPYLLERGDGYVEVPVPAGQASKDRRTTYEMVSTVSTLTANRLVIDTEVPFFDRAFRLSGKAGEGQEIQLASGRFARVAGDPMPVTIEFPQTRVTEMKLVIEDGDDAPLPLRSFAVRVPVPDVFLAAPAGSYALLMGAADARPPSYELARVRDVVLSVAAGVTEAGPMEKNPDYSRTASLASAPGKQRVLLWAAIVVAVVVLGALTLRLARQNPA